MPGQVTVARMPELTVHNWSRTTAVPAQTVPDQTEALGVAPGVLSRELPSGDASPESWGPRIADEDLDLVIQG